MHTQHPCPICRRVTPGALTDDGLRFACCRECLDTTIDELLETVEHLTRAWICRGCGCSNARACIGGCSWVAPSLCSRCAENSRGAMLVTGVDVKRDRLEVTVKGYRTS